MTQATGCPPWCDGLGDEAAGSSSFEVADAGHVHSTTRYLHTRDEDDFTVKLHADHEDGPGPDETITVDGTLDLTPPQARSLAALLAGLANLAEQGV
jgi:hypothetical protein